MTTPASAACGMSAISGDEEQRDQHGRHRAHHAGDLGARAAHAIHRRLRGATARGHRSEKCTDSVRRAGRKQLSVGPSRRILVRWQTRVPPPWFP